MPCFHAYKPLFWSTWYFKKKKKLFKLTIHRLNRIQKSKPQRAGGNVPTAEPLVLLYIDIINIVINV